MEDKKTVTLQEVETEDEKNSQFRSRIYIALLVVCVLCVACALWSGGNNETGDSNISAGISDVRGGIADSTDSNTKLQEQLGGIKQTTGSVADSVERSEAAVKNAASAATSAGNDLDTAERAIKNCQQIIAGIKQRNAIKGTNP